MNNKFLFILVVIAAATTTTIVSTTNEAFAQTPPPLEKAQSEPQTDQGQQQSLGKVTIQISQTEQIVIDLPLKSENKYQIVPIK
jgi:hypothetical protein